jgi:glucose-1-phosphate cytidylyltransferase
MEAVILCGGLGTRLREETEFKPKPMVEIGGMPILLHIMRHYYSFGVKDFVLCLGYKGEYIKDYFLNFRARNSDVAIDFGTNTVAMIGDVSGVPDWRVVLADTGAETLTGSRIKKVLKYLSGERFFATYGDGVADVDLGAVLGHHRDSGKQATVTGVRPSSRFGELVIEGQDITSFQEKPQVTEGWINGGFFVFERSAFEVISARDNVSLEVGVLAELAAAKQLSVYKHQGFWQCMDTYRERQLLNELWASGRAPWKTW